MTSLVAQTVKNMPAMQETRGQSLSQEDPLEKDMATHSSILAWRIPWTEESGGYRIAESETTEQLTFTFMPHRDFYSCLYKTKTSLQFVNFTQNKQPTMHDIH